MLLSLLKNCVKNNLFDFFHVQSFFVGGKVLCPAVSGAALIAAPCPASLPLCSVKMLPFWPKLPSRKEKKFSFVTCITFCFFDHLLASLPIFHSKPVLHFLFRNCLNSASCNGHLILLSWIYSVECPTNFEFMLVSCHLKLVWFLQIWD